jgi:hypothetical protein
MVIVMHKDFSKEYFDMQLRLMEADPRYEVIKKSDFVSLVKVRAGIYRPVFLIVADNYDLEPPLVEFANPVTGERLEDGIWPQGSPIATGNSLFPGPIICVSGNRSFHTHPGHLNQTFHVMRNNFTIKRITDRVADKIVSGQLNMSFTGGIYNYDEV